MSSCYWTAFVLSLLGKPIPVDVDSNIVTSQMLIQKEQLFTADWSVKLMNVQEERTRIKVKEACGHYAKKAYGINGDKALRRK